MKKVNCKKTLLVFGLVLAFSACFAFTAWSFTPTEVASARTKAETDIAAANAELVKKSYHDAGYAEAVKVIDQAMLQYFKGRWFMGKANGEYEGLAPVTHAQEDWDAAYPPFVKSSELAQLASEALIKGQTKISFDKAKVTSKGTEIVYVDGEVPIVPSIDPIIILQGSDYEMGYQYAQQAIEIFGTYIFNGLASQTFTNEQHAIIAKWEDQLRIHTPEIIDMAKGMAAGATEAGCPLDYEHALEMWTGHSAPSPVPIGWAEGYNQFRPPCSGCAAWGKATKDGKLVVGATTDHDCSPQATIVAFPKTGNNYIFTPIGVTNYNHAMGDIFMAGHPAMNNKGVAFPHHGNGAPACEPYDQWGYGVRRGASSIHTIRFANTAREALGIELSYPVGDDSAIFGSAGGFYADDTYGFVLNNRSGCPNNWTGVIREKSHDYNGTEYDFLYANNSMINENCPWFPQDENWVHDPVAGWYAKVWPYAPYLQYLNTTPGIFLRLAVSPNSAQRNRFQFNNLKRGYGKIDLDFMKMMYRKAEDPGKEEFSTGRKNAFSTVMKPDNGNEGLYYGCVGATNRSLATYFYYDMTNAYWELKLADSPAEVTAAAHERAEDYINEAQAELSKLHRSDNAYKPLRELLFKAKKEFSNGNFYQWHAGLLSKFTFNRQKTDYRSINKYAEATRAFTRAQVRAQQVYNALVPPPDSFEDLGL